MVPLPLVILGIERVITLVKAGIATVDSVADAVAAGRAAVKNAEGRELGAADVREAVARAQAQALATGDHAAERLADRHAADGTGEP